MPNLDDFQTLESINQELAEMGWVTFLRYDYGDVMLQVCFNTADKCFEFATYTVEVLEDGSQTRLYMINEQSVKSGIGGSYSLALSCFLSAVVESEVEIQITPAEFDSMLTKGAVEQNISVFNCQPATPL